MKRIASILALVAVNAAAPALAANAFSNDATDLWWNPDESGWGVNIIQQSNVLFATFFVYDQNGQPHWYVASGMVGTNAATSSLFSGRLYETTGPAFSAATFDASSVTRRDVGSATFELTPPDGGTLTYSVDGVTVTKRVNRQTWAPNQLSGKYFGGQMTQKSPVAATGCSPKTGLQVFDDITVNQSGSSFSMTAVLGGAPPQELCNYTGTYSQMGHMGNVEGAYSCNSGANGTFALREVEAGTNGLSASYSGTDRGCAVTGNFSAVRTD